jgi:uncharacterized protein
MQLKNAEGLAPTAPQPEIASAWAISSLPRFWPVRLMIYLGAMVLVVILTKVASVPLVPAPSSPAYEPIVTVRNILQAAAMIAVYSFLVRKIERRNARETAIHGAGMSLLSGVAIGSGLIATVYGIMHGFGVAQFDTGNGLSNIVTAILKPAVVGTLEELVFRVILFRLFQSMFGTLAAVGVSALLFGLAHSANPGATPLALAFLSIEMGVFLALVFTLTRSLWAVAGLHMGWNFALGSIFGSDVSGLESSNAMIATTLKGPTFMTGGAFGPEGSIITLCVSIIAIVVTIWLIARRGAWQPLKWEMRASHLPDAAYP